MRLTLRTLLAYLDDVLEPSAAREIGSKLAESSHATALVERIRDIIRRRRIGAPDLSGPGASPSPNVIAEYLDNTLTGNDVEDLERLCLESDVHLAEVAACHKILTLVLGEPVDVPQSVRERMYALGDTMPGESAAAASLVRQMQASTKSSSSDPVSQAAGSPAQVLPRELTQQNSRGTVLAVAGLLLVLGAWVGLVIHDHGLLPVGKGRPTQPQAGGIALAPPVNGAEAEAEELGDPAGEMGDGVAAMVAVPEASVPVEGSPPGEPEQPLIATVPSPSEAPAADSSIPDGVVSVIPDPPLVSLVPDLPGVAPSDDMPLEDAVAETAETPLPGVGSVPAVIPLGSPVQLLYSSREDLLLHRLDDPAGWFVMPRNAIVRDGQEIACPEPFEAQVLISGATCKLELVGGTRLRSLGPNPAGMFGFEIDRGRMVFTHTGMPEATPARFGLLIDGVFAHIELQPGTVMGLQVDRIPPSGRIADAIPVPQTRVHVFVTTGRGLWHPEDRELLELSPEIHGSLTWQNPNPLYQSRLLRETPAWFSGMGIRTGTARQTARQFENLFLLDQSVETTLPTIVRHDESRISELAVRMQGLIGEYPQLVRALDTDKEGAILAAAAELSIWLPRDADNDNRLKQELDRNIRRPEDATLLAELLWGFSEADARRPDLSQKLVEALGHPNTAIRLLAFQYVRGFTGVTKNYHPLATLPQREAGLNNWRDHLRRNGGALIAP